MICPNCGNELPDDSMFCSECGQKIENYAVTPDSNSQPVHQQYNQPVYNQAQYNQPVYNQPQYNQPDYNQPQYNNQGAYQQNEYGNYAAGNGYGGQTGSIPQPAGWKKFLSVLLCIIAGFFLVYVIAMTGVRISSSKSSLKGFLHKQVKAGEERMMTEVMDDVVSGSLSDLGYEEEGLELAEELTALILHEMMSYMLNGGDAFDADKICNWVEDNKKRIEKITGEKIDKSYMKELKQEIKEANKDIKNEVFEDDNFKEIYAVIGLKTFIISIVVVLIGFGLMGLMFGKRIDKTIVYSGVTTICYSILSLVIFSILVSVLKIQSDAFENIFASYIFSKCNVAALIFLVVGIVVVVCGKKIRSSKTNFA